MKLDKCPKCKGARRFSGLGMVIKDCPKCQGKGSVLREIAAPIPIHSAIDIPGASIMWPLPPEQKRRGRPKKIIADA